MNRRGPKVTVRHATRHGQQGSHVHRQHISWNLGGMEPRVRHSIAPLAETALIRGATAFVVIYAGIGWALPAMDSAGSRLLLRLAQLSMTVMGGASVGLCVLYAQLASRAAETAKWALEVASNAATPSWHARALVSGRLVDLEPTVYFLVVVPLLIPGLVLIMVAAFTDYAGDEQAHHMWILFAVFLFLFHGIMLTTCFVRRTRVLQSMRSAELLRVLGFFDPDDHVRICKALAHPLVNTGPFVESMVQPDP
jgi:hypothetical protein